MFFFFQYNTVVLFSLLKIKNRNFKIFENVKRCTALLFFFKGIFLEIKKGIGMFYSRLHYQHLNDLDFSALWLQDLMTQRMLFSLSIFFCNCTTRDYHGSNKYIYENCEQGANGTFHLPLYTLDTL